MSNSDFRFIGKLSIGKESDTFKPFEEKKFSSGWMRRTLKFNAICGDNRHFLEIEDGFWQDGHGDIYTFSKSTKDTDGNIKKGEKLIVPWSDRKNPEIVKNVAKFKKWVVDLEEPNKRFALEKAITDFKNNSILDETLVELGCDSLEALQTALEESKAKCKEFITAGDYLLYVNKLISSDKYKNRIFKIFGELVINESKGKFYKHYYPTRIYLAAKDEEVKSEASLVVYFNKDSLDDMSLTEKGEYYINGFIRNYDNQRKREIPCPITLTIKANGDEKSNKLAEVLKNQFVITSLDENEWKEYGVLVHVINGAQKVEITEDMLNDVQKELILLGELTLDDVRKDTGNSAYGEKVIDMVIFKWAKGYSDGSHPTTYCSDDFVIIDEEQPVEATDNSEDIDDINFDDNDEI